MMLHDRSRRSARGRLGLRAGCAAAALAAMCGTWTSAAFAQAFSGSPSVTAGQVNFDRTIPGQETITVIDDAIVDWTPIEGPGGLIDFLPAGNTAIFQDTPGAGGFVILNRIVPTGTGVVELNGNIISQLQTGAGNVRGGTVAFYSPNGLLVGSTAVFDVGNLILSAADLDPGSFQDFGSGNGALSLTAAPGSQARVEVQPGALINATAENSFLAMVAPRVVMNGNARINGSTAYVAAESVDITLVEGLFDIVVTTGTTVAGTIIEHGGSTGGPARTGTDANQAIYAVGVGQAQAVQLVFSGNLGFDPATSASIVNGEVILSAGFDVSGREFPDAFRGAGNNEGNASVRIVGGGYSSGVTGLATTDFTVDASATGSVNFDSDVRIAGFSNASIVAGAGESITIGGSAIVSADDIKNFTVANLAVTAQLDAQGGVARITAADGGTIAIGGDAQVSANARAANDGVRNLSGDATGGDAQIFASSGGQITIDGAMTASADARGSDSYGGGGSGTGGLAVIGVNGGTLFAAGDVAVSAAGQGGFGIGGIPGSDPGTGGNGSGGNAQIFAENGNLTLGNATVSADAAGGNGTSGGDAIAGNAGIITLGGEIQVDGDIVASADGVGGNASEGFGGQGGAAEGGTAYVQAQSPGIGRLIGAAATVTANATGGAGGAGDGGSVAAGAGGEARAGLFDGAINSGGAFVLAGREQANLALTDIRLEAVGTGGAGGVGGAGQAGGAGGAAFGGTTQLGSFTGDATSSLLGSVMQFDTAVALSSATGGAGGAGPAGAGAGGDASSGVAYVTATSGGLVIGNDVDLISDAQGGAGSTGGDATGLQAGLSTAGAIEIADVNIQVRTLGGAGASGGAGAATGGNLLVETAAGAFGSVGTVLVESLNGDITTQGDVATSTPGTVDLVVPVGEAVFTNIQVAALEDTPGQLTPAASQVSTGGLISFLETAQFTVDGDIEISTTGSGQILGGPDIDTPTALVSFSSLNGAITISGVNDEIINLGAQTLSLASDDIEILEGARIGALDLSLNANDTGEVVTLGGDEQGPGYTLTQAEAARIEGESIGFNGGDIVVRDLTITGSPDDGPSFVELEADNVSVQGALVYLAGSGDTLSIDAADGVLEVITPTGSISVNDGETLAGRLEIEAATTIVADAELAARIRQDPDFEGLAEALAENSGPNNPEGYLQAATIVFSFDGEPGEPPKAVFIQNSGDDTTFGGVATRVPGLVFALEDDDDEAVQLRVIAYGAGLDASGNVVTGSAYFDGIAFGEAPAITYSDDSEFNGLFVNTGLPARPGLGQVEGGAIVGSEVISGPLAQVVTFEPGEEDRDVAFGAAFPTLIDTADLVIDAAIDQAVASGGDAALWRAGADQDDEDDEDQQEP
ncbi:beta strand repeat-containing protein [Sphingosinicella terrae]|uniref:beta strand repeat-containing protein n=1 Tax=Sphingosinicella terrae TaxID=2172047 RepID=UPI000E0D1B78|nr:hypothetical protein [Sphingosinicella terrae]